MKTTSYRVVNAFFEHEQEERKLLLLVCKNAQKVRVRLYRKRDVRKKTAAFFLILALLMVMFFTFQTAEGTTSLSETVRMWMENQGLMIESHALRSNIHLLEYFILGLAVLAFGMSRGWKLSTCVIIGCLIGLIDEGIKILIPTREFDVIDLVKDWAGIGLATAFKSFLNIKAKER